MTVLYYILCYCGLSELKSSWCFQMTVMQKKTCHSNKGTQLSHNLKLCLSPVRCMVTKMNTTTPKGEILQRWDQCILNPR